MNKRNLLNSVLFLPALAEAQQKLKKQSGEQNTTPAERKRSEQLMLFLSLRFPRLRVRLILLSRRAAVRLLCLGIRAR